MFGSLAPRAAPPGSREGQWEVGELGAQVVLGTEHLHQGAIPQGRADKGWRCQSCRGCWGKGGTPRPGEHPHDSRTGSCGRVLIPANLLILMVNEQIFISGFSHVFKQEIKHVKKSAPYPLPEQQAPPVASISPTSTLPRGTQHGPGPLQAPCSWEAFSPKHLLHAHTPTDMQAHTYMHT